MPNLAIIAVGLRVTGVWIVLSSDFVTIELIFNSIYTKQFTTVILLLGDKVIWLVIAAVMIIKPILVVRLLVPRAISSERRTDWIPEEFQSLAFSFIGLYLLIDAFTAETIWKFVPLESVDNNPIVVSFHEREVLRMVTKLVVGLWLLFGVKGWLAIFRTASRARLTRGLP